MATFDMCTRCLIPATMEKLTFDANGVCNHCRKYDEDFAEWDLIKDRKAREFETILLKAKSLKRPYDCLVPLSGGKDSTYTLYLATKVYKLHTLTVSLDNGFLSPAAKDNIDNALLNCDADHIYYTINKKNTNELFRNFVEQTGDFCTACMRAINFSIEMAADRFRIPLIIKGSGRRVQYMSQIKGISALNTPSYYSNVLKGTSGYAKFLYLAGRKYKLELQKIAGGVADVLGFKRLFMMRFFPQHIGLYDYIYLPFPEIVDIIKREMGWSDSNKAVEHLDCELHDVPFYSNTLLRPELGKNTLHYSGLIRQGIMTREEALQRDTDDRANQKVPLALQDWLDDNGMTYEEYVHFVKNTNRFQFEPKLQVIARDIYHKLRKF